MYILDKSSSKAAAAVSSDEVIQVRLKVREWEMALRQRR